MTNISTKTKRIFLSFSCNIYTTIVYNYYLLNFWCTVSHTMYHCTIVIHNNYCEVNVAKLGPVEDHKLHIQIPPTGYVGLLWCNTSEATASWSTVEGTLKVRCSCYDRRTVRAVAAAYHSTLNGTQTCSNPSGTASYETYVVGQKESGCALPPDPPT